MPFLSRKVNIRRFWTNEFGLRTWRTFMLAFLRLEKRPHFNYACIHHLSTFQKRDSLDSRICHKISGILINCAVVSQTNFIKIYALFLQHFLRLQIRFCKIFNLLILECMLSTVHRGLKSATQSKIFPSARTAD